MNNKNQNFSDFLKNKNKIPTILYIIIAICSIVVMFVNIWLGVVQFLIVALIYVINIILYKRSERNNSEMMQLLSSHLDVTAKDSILNIPIPVSVVDSDGKLLWYNDLFAKITKERETDYGYSIKEICPDFDNNVFEERNITRSSIGVREYNVYQNIINTEDFEALFMMYWIDITDCFNAQKLYNDSRPAVAYIVIDNYNELMQDAKEAEQAIISGIINDTLISWGTTQHSIIQRMTKQKYIIYMDNVQLEKFIGEKFSILDKIRALNHITKMPATISIGLGYGGKDLKETENYAKQSFDMALGRGGDQAAIKNAEGFTFFGGKNKIVEKRTKVRSRIIANALSELITASSGVIVMGHKYADLDVMGSAIGVAKAVKSLGKNVSIVVNEKANMCDEMIQKFKSINEYNDMFIDAQDAILKSDKNTLLIIVDTHSAALVESEDLYDTCLNVVVIDHHRRSANYIERAVISYHETFASSASEMVAELIEHIAPEALNKTEAEAIMAGIMLDTKNFSMRTGVRTFEAASYLKRMGADTMEARKYFRGGLQLYRTKSSIVSNAEIYNKNIAIATASDESAVQDIKTSSAQAADDLLTIAGIEASFVLFHADNTISISGRSLGEINVQLICEKLGGGGHYQMAGAQIENTDMDSALKKLHEAIDDIVK